MKTNIACLLFIAITGAVVLGSWLLDRAGFSVSDSTAIIVSGTIVVIELVALFAIIAVWLWRKRGEKL